MQITPVILCGGSGTRLWPLSRTNYPKQFVKVVDDQTLFETTLLRVAEVDYFTAPLIICNEKHQYLCLEQLHALNIEPLDIIIEPVGRNTTPAITIACLHVQQLLGQDAAVLVLPIDHVFGDHHRYFEVIRQASQFAMQHLITFGIKPSYAHTGYGYIKRGLPLVDDFFEVQQFIEKPSLSKAEQLLAAGDVYWNSGTFLFGATCFLTEVKRWHNTILENCKASLIAARRQQNFLKLAVDAFAVCDDISVDYAILEKTDKVIVAAW